MRKNYVKSAILYLKKYLVCWQKFNFILKKSSFFSGKKGTIVHWTKWNSQHQSLLMIPALRTWLPDVLFCSPKTLVFNMSEFLFSSPLLFRKRNFIDMFCWVIIVLVTVVFGRCSFWLTNSNEGWKRIPIDKILRAVVVKALLFLI